MRDQQSKVEGTRWNMFWKAICWMNLRRGSGSVVQHHHHQKVFQSINLHIVYLMCMCGGGVLGWGCWPLIQDQKHSQECNKVGCFDTCCPPTMVKCRALLSELLVVDFHLVRSWGGVSRKEGLLRIGCSVFMMGGGGCREAEAADGAEAADTSWAAEGWVLCVLCTGTFYFGPRQLERGPAFSLSQPQSAFSQRAQVFC